MPRNRYIAQINDAERTQIAQQEEELTRFARSLGRKDTDISSVQVAGDGKERRRIRREQQRRHKPERFRGANKA
ncbi:MULTISPECIES: hypothetical protein [unclassified Streptomyces]|uniref:hypothetical protein n=1 Tax=unclassified Streptomyces TaxID=2593676 RepID=UPI001EF01C85|nr:MULTISPECIES: hypothetical protein [unclassified Streptomyces]UIX33358.1 hypothetical protein LUX31_26965 [Streptomyces sp. GQFP]UJV42761.1 hypothetical protein CVT30_25585 [Streptomyces sp. AMCC400023]